MQLQFFGLVVGTVMSCPGKAQLEGFDLLPLSSTHQICGDQHASHFQQRLAGRLEPTAHRTSGDRPKQCPGGGR